MELVLRREWKERRVFNSHRRIVNIFKVAAQVATLSEVLAAEAALERSLASVLSKVISQVAGFLENSATVGILALKE